MRTLVLVLMVALLPLRMWAAEGMAVRMAQQQVAAAEDSAHMASMPEDCPMAAQAKADAEQQGEAPQAAGHCAVCYFSAAAACQSQQALPQGPPPAGPPAFGSWRYASAEVPPDLRPPIS